MEHRQDAGEGHCNAETEMGVAEDFAGQPSRNSGEIEPASCLVIDQNIEQACRRYRRQQIAPQRRPTKHCTKNQTGRYSNYQLFIRGHVCLSTVDRSCRVVELAYPSLPRAGVSRGSYTDKAVAHMDYRQWVPDGVGERRCCP
jgi:hypothetical protein